MAGRMAQQVADPYADALISIAQSQTKLSEFAEGIRLILDTLRSTPELQTFLESPVFSAEKKKSLLADAFSGKVEPVLLNTLQLLTDRRRVMFLESVCLRFLDKQRQIQKIALAEVTSAIELSSSQQDTIQERVKQLENVTSVELETMVDPALIGGFVIKVGSQVIDLSLRGQLRRLALQLT